MGTQGTSKIRVFALFLLCGTHYSISRSSVYNFDICRVLVKVPGPYQKSHFELVALFEPHITYLSSFLIYIYKNHTLGHGTYDTFSRNRCSTGLKSCIDI